MSSKSVIHYRQGRNFVVCGADKPRRNWNITRDVVAVGSMVEWENTKAVRCTRCAAKVAKMKAVKEKNEARKTVPVALPAPLQRLRARYEAIHANDGASMGLLH